MPNEPNNNRQMLPTFLEWRKEAEKKISRHLFWLMIITISYIYYALIAPFFSNGRIEKIQIAKGDMVVIISQFKDLSSIYNQFISLPPTSITQYMSIFQDQIIPLIQSEINDSNAQQKVEQIQLLDSLSADMTALTELYNIHHNFHPLNFPNQIATIEYLGGDKNTLDEYQKILSKTEHLENDPIFELDQLIKLELTIQNLIKFSTKDENFNFCELAQKVCSKKFEKWNIPIQNNLTETFKPFKLLSGSYSNISINLKFLPNEGLSSYKSIKNIIAPPFEVKTIDDLLKLRSFAENSYEQNLRENSQNYIEIPTIGIRIDKTILILLIPSLILILLHLLNSYLTRYLVLLGEIEKINVKSKSQYLFYAPYFYPIWKNSKGIQSILIYLMVWGMIIVPLIVCIVFFIYVYQHITDIFWLILLYVFGAALSFFTGLETYYLYCNLNKKN